MKTRTRRDLFPGALDLFPGALEMMVLRTLKRRPIHGYALTQEIKSASRDLLQVEEGSPNPAFSECSRMAGFDRSGRSHQPVDA